MKCKICDFEVKSGRTRYGNLSAKQAMVKHMKRHPLYNPKKIFKKKKKRVCSKCAGEISYMNQNGLCQKCYWKNYPRKKYKTNCACGNPISKQSSGRCRDCYFDDRYGNNRK